MPDWIKCFFKACSLTKTIPQAAFLPYLKNKHLQWDDAAYVFFSREESSLAFGDDAVIGQRAEDPEGRWGPLLQTAELSFFYLESSHPAWITGRLVWTLFWNSTLFQGTFVWSAFQYYSALPWEPHAFVGLRVIWFLNFLSPSVHTEGNSGMVIRRLLL